jgi:FdhE protein
MTASTILQPGQVEAPAGDIPFLHLPARDSIFKDRAERFRQLAPGHKLGDFLAFMAHLADAQQAALADFAPVPLPDANQHALCKQHGMPPLAARAWKRDAAWRDALVQISGDVFVNAPPVTQETIIRLHGLDESRLELLADAMLDGRFHDMDLAAAPFVAAALQTYWVHMVGTIRSALGTAAFGRTDMPNLCPVCASAPVASIVRIGAEQGLRYLHCSLCATEWHMVRTKCSNCESTKGIAYYGIEGDKGAVKAEACAECSSYLKILYLDKDPQLDPTADDLATLALDILLDEKGVQRSGPNLFLVPA